MISLFLQESCTIFRLPEIKTVLYFTNIKKFYLSLIYIANFSLKAIKFLKFSL